MKILICNIAIRPKPDPFPPVACTSLCNVLIKAGFDPVFYDIDAERPSPEELYKFFQEGRFDIVGISAVVSTGYKYTKNLADIIKKASPAACVILGGNLAAAYEVILRKCRIDICVIGEGEKVLLNLAKHLERRGHFEADDQGLNEIKGIAFLSPGGACCFTGHEELLPGDEIPEPDYELLGRFSNIGQYILDPMKRYDFLYDTRSHEPGRKGKKMATIFTSKGCINKCTFCHRWIKRYRVIPVEKIVSTVKYLMEKHSVGFFCISDECFGESGEWLEEFIRAMKTLDVLFQIGGMRVSVVKKDSTVIKRLKEAGLTAVYFGMESGSDKILDIMEKNATRDENLRAVRICAEAGIYTVIQLVLGMPGESSQTIEETIDFVKKASELLPYPAELSVNYLQALPGTPCYSLLRHYGFLGKTIEDEERYLCDVSDIDAAEYRQYINVSEEPLSEVKLWAAKIRISNRIHWLKYNGWKNPLVFNYENGDARVRRGIAAKMKLFFRASIVTYRIIDSLGESFWKLMLLKNRVSLYGVKKAVSLAFGFTCEEDRSAFKIPASLTKGILKSE